MKNLVLKSLSLATALCILVGTAHAETFRYKIEGPLKHIPGTYKIAEASLPIEDHSSTEIVVAEIAPAGAAGRGIDFLVKKIFERHVARLEEGKLIDYYVQNIDKNTPYNVNDIKDDKKDFGYNSDCVFTLPTLMLHILKQNSFNVAEQLKYKLFYKGRIGDVYITTVKKEEVKVNGEIKEFYDLAVNFDFHDRKRVGPLGSSAVTIRLYNEKTEHCNFTIDQGKGNSRFGSLEGVLMN